MTRKAVPSRKKSDSHTFGEPGIIPGGYPGQPGPKEMIYLSVGVVPSSLQGQAGRAAAATAFRAHQYEYEVFG